jgi:type II secretory pathway pseudopilin PulG
MNKKFIIIVSLLLIVLLAGCDQIPQVKQLKESYLQTRVAQLVTQMATKDTTEEPKELPTATALPPAETLTQTLPSFPADATETPTIPTLTPTEAPTFTPIPTSIPVTATPTVMATLTSTPTVVSTVVTTFTPTSTVVSTDPAIFLGKPVWKDPFDENKGWAVDTDAFSSASIANGVMTLTTKSTMDAWRLAPTSSLGNNYVEAIFTTGVCDANDHFGLMFRVPVLEAADQGYQFGITCDGRYLLRKYDGKVGENGSMISLIPWTPSAEIRAGSNQTNRIGMMTINDRLIMFINGVLVGEFKDTTYLQGYIGFFLGSRTTKNLTIKMDNLTYWSNPKTP